MTVTQTRVRGIMLSPCMFFRFYLRQIALKDTCTAVEQERNPDLSAGTGVVLGSSTRARTEADV